jgi:hypothetical protein
MWMTFIRNTVLSGLHCIWTIIQIQRWFTDSSVLRKSIPVHSKGFRPRILICSHVFLRRWRYFLIPAVASQCGGSHCTRNSVGFAKILKSWETMILCFEPRKFARSREWTTRMEYFLIVGIACPALDRRMKWEKSWIGTIR